MTEDTIISRLPAPWHRFALSNTGAWHDLVPADVWDDASPSETRLYRAAMTVRNEVGTEHRGRPAPRVLPDIAEKVGLKLGDYVGMRLTASAPDFIDLKIPQTVVVLVNSAGRPMRSDMDVDFVGKMFRAVQGDLHFGAADPSKRLQYQIITPHGTLGGRVDTSRGAQGYVQGDLSDIRMFGYGNMNAYKSFLRKLGYQALDQAGDPTSVKTLRSAIKRGDLPSGRYFGVYRSGNKKGRVKYVYPKPDSVYSRLTAEEAMRLIERYSASSPSREEMEVLEARIEGSGLYPVDRVREAFMAMRDRKAAERTRNLQQDAEYALNEAEGILAQVEDTGMLEPAYVRVTTLLDSINLGYGNLHPVLALRKRNARRKADRLLQKGEMKQAEAAFARGPDAIADLPRHVAHDYAANLRNRVTDKLRSLDATYGEKRFEDMTSEGLQNATMRIKEGLNEADAADEQITQIIEYNATARVDRAPLQAMINAINTYRSRLGKVLDKMGEISLRRRASPAAGGRKRNPFQRINPSISPAWQGNKRLKDVLKYVGSALFCPGVTGTFIATDRTTDDSSLAGVYVGDDLVNRPCRVSVKAAGNTQAARWAAWQAVLSALSRAPTDGDGPINASVPAHASPAPMDVFPGAPEINAALTAFGGLEDVNVPYGPRQAQATYASGGVVDKSDSRYGLRHVHISEGGDLVATDGHRLYWFRAAGPRWQVQGGHGIPRAVLETGNTTKSRFQQAGPLFLRNDGVFAVYDGADFPQYEALLPRETGSMVFVLADLRAFIQSYRVVSKLLNARARAFALRVRSEEAATFQAATPPEIMRIAHEKGGVLYTTVIGSVLREIMSAKQIQKAEKAGVLVQLPSDLEVPNYAVILHGIVVPNKHLWRPDAVGFNPRYFYDVAQAALRGGLTSVRFEGTTALSPFLFDALGDRDAPSNFEGLIMPMRLD